MTPSFNELLAYPYTSTQHICEYLGFPLEQLKFYREEREDAWELEKSREMLDVIYFLFERILVQRDVEAVLFVDVDGVLYDETNNKKVKKQTKQEYPIDFSAGYNRDCVASKFFSQVAMRNVQILLSQVPNCALVLSSAWRTSRSQYELRKEIFAHWPWFANALISKTKDLKNRPKEIREWLTNHPNLKRYAIIDDNEHRGLSTFRERFIKISAESLFTKESDRDRVINALKSRP